MIIAGKIEVTIDDRIYQLLFHVRSSGSGIYRLRKYLRYIPKGAHAMTLRRIKLIYPDLTENIKIDALLMMPTVAITLDSEGMTAWHVGATDDPSVYTKNDQRCIFQYDYPPRRYTLADLAKIDGMTATEFILSMELRKGEDYR
jgi:hypothetical protein